MDERTVWRQVETAWGPMAIVARGGKLVGVVLPEASAARVAAQVAERWPDAARDDWLLPEVVAALDDYFAGRRARFDAPCDLSALTAFQRDVLAACAAVPAGRTVTYGELARRVGRPKAARAVGGAMAANPVPLVVPCHRVVGSGGQLGGFSAGCGTDLKRRLLEHERRHFG